MESKEVVDSAVLEQVSKVLKVPIENLTDEGAINIVANTFNEHAVNMNYQYTFTPLDKLIELHEDLISLYERMIKEKVGMIERMQKVLDDNK